MIGTLVNIEPNGRFGFIAPAAGGRNIFVHMDAIAAAGIAGAALGMKLSYEIEMDPTGRPRATAVRLIQRPTPGVRYATRDAIPRRSS